MVVSQTTASSLLEEFGLKNRTLQSVHDELKKIRKPSKLYQKIETLLCQYSYHSAHHFEGQLRPPENGTADVDDPRVGSNDLPVAHKLKVILDFESAAEDDEINKADLLGEAIRVWPPEGSQDTWESSAEYIIVHALCLSDPEIPFTSTVMATQDLSLNSGSSPVSPFQLAARSGATMLVKVMIHELRNKLQTNNDQQLEKNAQDFISRTHRSGSKSAFLLAAENLWFDVLRLLLDAFPGLADMHSIRAVIQKTKTNEKRDQDTALDAFKLIDRYMHPTTKSEIWSEAVKMSSTKVVAHFIKETGDSFVTYDRAKFLIEHGNVNMWNEISQAQQNELMGNGEGDLLHTAVKYRKADIVEDILQRFPDQIRVKSGQGRYQYAMEHLGVNTEGGSKSDCYERIRSALLHAMIRSPDLGIREIRAILRKSEVEADMICLHLSTIDTEQQSFAEYALWIQQQKEEVGKIFKFEKILKYAKFPDLHTQTPNQVQDVVASLREHHCEVRVVFEWLRKRNVTQVLELSVPDRLLSPHSDESIRYCVDEFQVQILRWRKLDLYLGNLDDRTKANLQELHLYSSGNQAVHDHWYRELENFNRLQRLFVHVVADVMSETRLKASTKELKEKLSKIFGNKFHVGKPKTQDQPGLKKDMEKRPTVSVKEYHWATERACKTYRNFHEIRNNVVGPNLTAFIDKYVSYKMTEDAKTKVALIDSGIVLAGGKSTTHNVDKTGPPESNGPPREGKVEELRSINDLAEHVVHGKFYVSTGDDEEQVWWHASEPHGTQMARLICSIDPRCQLYVAKVAETKSSGIAANVVADAIEWAIKMGVDVISLSFAVYTDTGNLTRAIQRAHKNDIVVLVSTADEGMMTTTTLTNEASIRDNLLTIAACDRWGNLLPTSQRDGFNFSFVGHDVQVGQIPFLKSEESISGSSVATAIAAGTASLILACCRISSRCNTKGDDSGWRCRMVRDRFAKMGEGYERSWKYIALENLCGKSKKLENIDFKHTVDSEFVLE